MTIIATAIGAAGNAIGGIRLTAYNICDTSIDSEQRLDETTITPRIRESEERLMELKFLVVCGTNRQGALSRLLATEVLETYRQLGQQVDLLDMAELTSDALLPDAYKERPLPVQPLVDRFLESSGVIFIIPEYNGSYPGVLKLFVDMLPFPEGLDERPCAFVGLAAGQFKSLRAVEHFQQVCGYRNALIYPRRLFIGESFSQFIDGKLSDDELTKRLHQQAGGFVDFVQRLKG